MDQGREEWTSGVLAWQRPDARAVVLLCARMFACNQLTSCLSLLPPWPSTALPK